MQGGHSNLRYERGLPQGRPLRLGRLEVGVLPRRQVRPAREALLDAAEEAGGGVYGRRRDHADRADRLVRVVWVELRGVHRPVGHLEIKLEAAQQHDDRDRRLEERELVAHALALPRAEGDHGVVRRDLEVCDPQPSLGLHLARLGVEAGALGGVVARPPLDVRVVERPVPPLRVEDVRLLPQLGRAAHVVRRDEEVVRASEREAALDARSTLGPLVRLGGAPDEEGRRGPHAQCLCNHLLHLGHALDVVDGGVAVADHGVDLVLHTPERLRVLREGVGEPGEDRGRRLVPRDEQRDEVVAHLLVVDLLAAQVDEEAKHGRVLDLGVVLALERVELLGVARVEALVDQLVQHRVEEVHVGVELDEPRDELVRTRNLPVRCRSECAVLDLAECADGRLDHGRLLVHRPELIVEDRLADHVEGERTVPLLHVEDGAGLRRLEQLRDQVRVGLPKLTHHPLEVELVEAGRDRAPPLRPRDRVCGDQTLAHDVLEDEGEGALVVVLAVLAEDVPRNDGVARDHERLWAEAHLVHRPVPVEVRL
mmetsp:Transcript_19855/g.58878  ORF Transcript_19855/g.58878 Transcript_19855/m.58878 type:complete len:539 (-) Transcript_19855:545-2161(-)